MIDLKNITLVTVSSVEIEDHIKALRYSSQYFKFGRTLFISDKTINEPGIDWIECDKIKDKLDYSFYMVNEFPAHIDTEFVLIVQADGFIINPHKWSEIFLEYDYIGAPFPDNPEYGFTGDTRVGNGGFSLRSKKLIDMPIKLNFPNRVKGVDVWWEDNYYCVAQRHNLQKNGCKFAPLEVAKHFSHEYPWLDPEWEKIEPFGFHSKPNINYYDFENQHKKRVALRPQYYNWPI